MPRRIEVQEDGDAQARAAAQLQNLQQELTTTRTKPSFGAALERAAQRIDRKQKAATAPFAADARHLRSDLRPEDVPLDLVYTEGRDEREDEPWFKQLPLEEQDRLLRQWHGRELRLRREPVRWDKRLLRGACHGLAAFLLTALLQIPLLGAGPIPVMLLAGALAGVLMNLTRPSRFRCSAIGGAVYLLAIIAPVTIAGGAMEAIVAQALPILYGFAIAVCTCGLIGFDHEARRSGGF
jgi:hypothetical protein